VLSLIHRASGENEEGPERVGPRPRPTCVLGVAGGTRRDRSTSGAGVPALSGRKEGAIDIEAAYRRYGPMVLRRCRQLLRDEEKAVDAMHDVFVNLLRAEERLEGEGSASLLMRIATNVCLNHLRSARRRPEDADEEALLAIASVEEPGAQSVARLVLKTIFGREPESTRVMAVLHLVDGLTLEEVGREVGLSAAAVRKRLRGLKARVAALPAHDLENAS
jgi:RNA polymerase sigma-70 factor (ECF subfamily)